MLVWLDPVETMLLSIAESVAGTVQLSDQKQFQSLFLVEVEQVMMGVVSVQHGDSGFPLGLLVDVESMAMAMAHHVSSD